jgi:serine/threonine protein kinase
VIEETMHREKFLQIIESENIIAGRFRNPKRIDENGGNGCFSLLFKAYDSGTKKEIALKFYDPTKLHNIERVQRFHREAQILKILEDEPYVINCHDGVCTLEKKMIDSTSRIEIPIILQFIPMDLAEYSLEDLIYSRDPSPLECLSFFKEIVKAIIRVHNRYICHRDLKPSNFLIFGKNICLSDFGTAKCMDGSMSDIRQSYDDPIGDNRYIAPEVLFSFGIADENVFLSDMFSMGAVLFEMFTRTRLDTQIWSKADLSFLFNLKQILSTMTESNRLETYKGAADQLARTIPLPDIYAYNDFVPKSIKLHLNELYKNLAAINFHRRMRDPVAIHRRIDICIKILRNEQKYMEWRKKKKGFGHYTNN